MADLRTNYMGLELKNPVVVTPRGGKVLNKAPKNLLEL